MKKMRMTGHKASLLAMAAAVIILVTTVQSMSVAAPDSHDFVDLEQICKLEVAYEDNLDFGNDIWYQAQVYLDLYKVADAVDVPYYDTYNYAATEPFKEVGVPETLEETNDYTAEDWKTVAQAAARVALGLTDEVIQPVQSISLQEIEFQGLDAGLYLLVPRGLVDTGALEGEDDERPIPGVDYLYVDEDGDGTDEKLVTCAYSKRYMYTFDPQLITLPNKDEGTLVDEEGNVITDDDAYSSNTGDWIYNVHLNLKMSREYRYGNLQIIKDLLENDTLDRDSQSGWITDPATFVFEINAVLYAQDANGEDDTQAAPLWSRTYNKAVHFTEAGLDDSILIEHIPAGAHITVTEVYSGAKYELDAEGSKTGVIDADDTISVSFANRYNRSKKNGYGITNHFEYQHSGTEGSGSWEFTGSNQGAPNAPAPAPGEPAEN